MTLTPGAGTYTSAQTVTATTTSPGATLRYTLSGAAPTLTDPVVPAGGIVVESTTTLRVKGFRSGWTDSDTAVATYQVNLGAAAAPVLAPAGGTFTSAQTVSITSATTGALVRFTTDGTEPSQASKAYSAALLVKEPTTITAKAFKAGWTPSATTIGTYAFEYGTVAIPTLTPAAGDYATRQTITIATATAGATIRYTTTGLDPMESDTAVAANGEVIVDRALRLKVRAFKAGMTPSATRTADYWITGGVVAGYTHSLALKADGSLWSWGANGFGQLGDGGVTQRLSPVAVSVLTDVVAMAAGSAHSLAVKRDGTCWAWGDNSSGQLGIGSSSGTQTTPVQVAGLTDIVAVAAGERHSLALKRDGTVWAWGNGGSGQIGDGATATRTSPVQAVNLTGVVAIAAGRYHSAALRTDGNLTGNIWTWGSSLTGQLGDGTINTTQSSPAAVFAGAVALTVHEDQTFVAAGDGTAWGWGGTNGYGHIGDDTQEDRHAAVRVLTLTDVVQVAADKENTYARTTNGLVWAWGNGQRTGMNFFNAGGVVKAPLQIPAAGPDKRRDWSRRVPRARGPSRRVGVDVGCQP